EPTNSSNRAPEEWAIGAGTSAPAWNSVLSTSHSWLVQSVLPTSRPCSVRLANARASRLLRMTRPSRYIASLRKERNERGLYTLAASTSASMAVPARQQYTAASLPLLTMCRTSLMRPSLMNESSADSRVSTCTVGGAPADAKARPKVSTHHYVRPREKNRQLLGGQGSRRTRCTGQCGRD